MAAVRGDAFGEALLAHLEDGEASAVIERDDGFFGTDELTPYFAPARRWPAHERLAVRHVRGRVLDVGCGAGRAALHFQDRHDVVAIDISPRAVEVSQRRGVADARVLSITKVGLDLGLFDTIVMFGNNFGLFGNANRARTLLRRFRSIATPDCRILAGSNDIHGSADPRHVRYQRANLRRGRMAGQFKLRVRYVFSVSDWFDFLLVSAGEMEQIVMGTGWHIDRIIGSGDPEDPHYVSILRLDRTDTGRRRGRS